MIRIEASAKVNLSLRILAREEAGYHQLETIFLGVQLSDSLSLDLGGSGTSLRVEGPSLGPPEENLIYRAAEGFFSLAGRRTGVRIRLSKRIPVQGGLGGGSSDAAATLKALSILLPGWVERKEIMALAGRLGSDVPFFLSRSPLALAWGRGDRLLALPPLPEASILLAVPPEAVSTPEAYRALALEREQQPGSRGPELHSLASLNRWEAIALTAENDFEPIVFSAHPVLGEIRQAMRRTDPVLSLLSGSGSVLFSVYKAQEKAREAAARLQEAFPTVRFLLTRSLSRIPDPILTGGVE